MLSLYPFSPDSPVAKHLFVDVNVIRLYYVFTSSLLRQPGNQKRRLELVS